VAGVGAPPLEAAIRTARAAGHSGDVSQFTIRRAAMLLVDDNTLAVELLLAEFERTPKGYPLLRRRAAWGAAGAELLTHYEQAAGGA